jgi:pilus assembly protein Flp/PilA
MHPQISSNPVVAAKGVPGALLGRLLDDDRGVAAIDYALLAGLVALAAVGGFEIMGIAVGDMFNTISSDFTQSMPQGG